MPDADPSAPDKMVTNSIEGRALYSILVVILIAVASVSKKNKKKGKAPESKGAVRFSNSGNKDFAEVKEFIKDVGKTVLEMEDDDFSAPAKIKAKVMKAKPANTAIEPAKPKVVPATQSSKSSIIEEGLGMAPVRSEQGFSIFEDQGCISGSIAHDSHEGDSAYLHGATEGLFRSSDDSVYAEDIARELQAMNVQRLRRAVVISEILDRPKALRRR